MDNNENKHCLCRDIVLCTTSSLRNTGLSKPVSSVFQMKISTQKGPQGLAAHSCRLHRWVQSMKIIKIFTYKHFIQDYCNPIKSFPTKL